MRASGIRPRGDRLLTCIAVLSIAVAARGQDTFEDDFERDDGPVDGWTVAQGNWAIDAGTLAVTTTGGAQPDEAWIWAGDPPIALDGDLRADLVVEFPIPGADVGAHGGVHLFASAPTLRWQTTGYTIDYLGNGSGYRLIRWDGAGALAILVGSTPEFTEPGVEWQIEVEADLISLAVDGVPVFDFSDETYRQGHFGVWGYGTGQETRFDDVSISYEPVVVQACGTATPDRGLAPLTVTFDASCSLGNIESYEWDFGDGATGTGVTVEHEYALADRYVASLLVTAIGGATEEIPIEVIVFEAGTDFTDDFNRDDGPPAEWTVAQGDWTIESGFLSGISSSGAQAGEAWIWAGDPPLAFEGDFIATLEVEFPVPGPEVGPHGGLHFFASDPTLRWQTDGYSIDYIGREAGYRLIRWDGGAFTVLQIVSGFEPGIEWEVAVEGDLIRFSVDGDVVIEFQDGTYRQGFFGLWGYGTGQQMWFDEVSLQKVEVELRACASATPDRGVAPLAVTFDASCSIGDIASYEWDFGDGTTGTGATVEHEYTLADAYVVSLVVTSTGGATDETTLDVSAFLGADSFRDDFERDDGPPSGWTIAQGEWSIVNDLLAVTTTGGTQQTEAWIWAGDPPLVFSGDTSVSVDIEFPVSGAEVGAHGGIHLYAGAPSLRWQTTGYTIDFLGNGTGYRLIRWDGAGALVVLVGSTPEFVEPGIEWQVEVEGDLISFSVDGEFVFEFQDGTYREGFIGLWGYGSGQETWFDNFAIGDEDVEPTTRFVRGDADASGAINITDGIFILNFLFLGGSAPPCVRAADADASDALNITDGIYVLNFLFLGGAAPPAPHPGCGEGEQALECAAFAPCGV